MFVKSCGDPTVLAPFVSQVRLAYVLYFNTLTRRYVLKRSKECNARLFIYTKKYSVFKFALAYRNYLA